MRTTTRFTVSAMAASFLLGLSGGVLAGEPLETLHNAYDLGRYQAMEDQHGQAGPAGPVLLTPEGAQRDAARREGMARDGYGHPIETLHNAYDIAG